MHDFGPPQTLTVSVAEEGNGGDLAYAVGVSQRASESSLRSSDGSLRVDVSDASAEPGALSEESSSFRRSLRLSREGDELKSPMMRQRMSFRASGLAGSLDSLVEDPGDFSMV